MYRKPVLFLLAFLCLSAYAIGQQSETFAIYPGTTYDVKTLEDGLAMCNLDKYRKPETRVNMVFDDGTIVELFSARELKDLNIPFEESHINRTELALQNTFKVHPKGYIIEQVKRWSKEEMAKQPE